MSNTDAATKETIQLAMLQKNGRELRDRGLPKWPQMWTTGKPVTSEQAKEIIRRTDSFFYYMGGGNDRKYNRRVKEALGMPLDSLDLERGERELPWAEEWWVSEEWKSNWEFIETEYVRNSWISSAFIFGPSGWCHPDGSIGFVDNVGKWPSIEDIEKEWQLLADAFPFLEIDVTLMSGESCEPESVPVVGLQVRNGLVTLVDPAEVKLHEGHDPAERGNSLDELPEVTALTTRMALGIRSEHGLPWSWIQEWADNQKRKALP